MDARASKSAFVWDVMTSMGQLRIADPGYGSVLLLCPSSYRSELTTLSTLLALSPADGASRGPAGAAPGRHGCRSGSSRCPHGQAWPAPPGGPHRCPGG